MAFQSNAFQNNAFQQAAAGGVTFGAPALAGTGASVLVERTPAGVNRHRTLVPIDRIAPPAVVGTGALTLEPARIGGWGDANDDELALFLLLAA